MDGNPDNVWMAVILTLGLGLLVGLIHAFLINEFNLSPFVVTFASLFILQGISLTITTKPIGRASRDFLMLYSQKFLGVPIIVYYFIFITLLIMFLLRKTVFGKHIYAIGGTFPLRSCRNSCKKSTLWSLWFMQCSCCFHRFALVDADGVGDPVIGKELELNAIIAVVIGGTSLFGGRGTVTGVLGGILLLTFTDNLLVVLGVNQFISGLIKGIIFVAAVALYKQADRAREVFRSLNPLIS